MARVLLHAAAWPLVIFLGAAGGCQTATQITVEVTTDVSCADATDTAIAVGSLDDLERRPATATSAHCDASGHVGTLVVVPSDAKNAEIGIRVVMGIDKSPEACVADGYRGGCIVARRALRYLPHTELRVKVPMSVVCRDVPCGATSTCSQGICAPSGVDPSTCTAPQGCDAPKPGLVASMSKPRTPFAASLPDGRVLVVSDDTAETYDPLVDAWTPMPNLGASHQSGASAQLSDGRFLIVGGSSGASKTDIFDPATNAWDSSLSMTQARIYAQMVRLKKGALGEDRFLVTGGEPTAPGNCTSTAEILDVPAKKATAVASMLDARCSHSMIVLADGRVLVVLGAPTNSSSPVNRAEIYDPVADKWTSAAPLPAQGFTDYAFAHPPIALLPDGTVLLVGLHQRSAIYDPMTDAWRALQTTAIDATSARVARVDATHFVSVLSSGGAPVVSQVNVFDATTLSWKPLTTLAVARNEPGVVTLANRRAVFVVGGRDASNGPSLASAEIVIVPP